MRLINADSLLQVIKKNIPNNPHDEYQEGQEIGLSMAVEMVCNEPTVDAEPVVRCKDCKYMFTQGKTTKFYFCNEFEISVDETDYCAWGEKKDE